MTPDDFRVVLAKAPYCTDLFYYAMDLPDTNYQQVQGWNAQPGVRTLGTFNDSVTLKQANQTIWGEVDGMAAYVVVWQRAVPPLLGVNVAAQVRVWRATTDTYTTGLARHVFNEYLLEQEGAITINGFQAEEASTFWRDRLSNALRDQHYIYYADSHARQVIAVEDREHLRQLRNLAYREDRQREERIFVISREPLPNH